MLLGAWPLGGKNSLPPPKNSKWRFLILCGGYTVFLIIGASVFSAIEAPQIADITKKIDTLRNKFLDRNFCLSDNDLEDFLTAVIRANDRGISPLRNVSNELNWGFGQALFFSTTVITTIGYGHVTPLSQTGKIFCMLYATIGIPLTLVLLTAVVERLLIPANWLLGSLNAKLGHLYQPFNIRLMHLSFIVVIVAIIFFAIPTAIFDYLESDWDTLDAFYYCFISLTTVGLGDYIPGDGVDPDSRSLYKIFITIYLICGLMAMMLALTIFYDIPQLNLGQLFTENSTGETEKLRLSGNSAPCYSGPSGLYITQRDDDMRRIRVRPHGDDSPSPSDEQSNISTTITGTVVGTTKDIRVP